VAIKPVYSCEIGNRKKALVQPGLKCVGGRHVSEKTKVTVEISGLLYMLLYDPLLCYLQLAIYYVKVTLFV